MLYYAHIFSKSMYNNEPYLSVIIVTWNSAADIYVCLTSLKQSLGQFSSEVFVVDNKSSDKTVDIVRKKHPWVKLLPQSTNWGFGEGNNIGLAQAKGKYIWLLNPDTKVNERAVRIMVRFLERHRTVGAVGPEQLNGKGELIIMKSKWSVSGLVEHFIEKIAQVIRGKTVILFLFPHKVYMLNCGCVMLRNDILPSRQWFDPKCFIYGEEEYLFSAINQTKWKSYFLRNCSIEHYREKSIGQTGKKWKYALDSFIILPVQVKIAALLSKIKTA